MLKTSTDSGSLRLLFLPRLKELSDCRNRALRSTETDLEIPRYKTSNGQRSFSYRGVTVWNQLSTKIKTAPSLAIFKTDSSLFWKTINTSPNEDYHVEASVWSIFFSVQIKICFLHCFYCRVYIIDTTCN